MALDVKVLLSKASRRKVVNQDTPIVSKCAVLGKAIIGKMILGMDDNSKDDTGNEVK